MKLRGVLPPEHGWSSVMYSAVQYDGMARKLDGVGVPIADKPLVMLAERSPVMRATAQEAWAGCGLLAPESADDAINLILKRLEEGDLPITHVVVGEFDTPDTAINFVLQLVAIGFDGDLVALTWPGVDREDLMVAGCNRRFTRAEFLLGSRRTCLI